MSQLSDYTDDSALMSSDYKQNFDLVSPEEIQYYSETLLHDFEELNRQSFIFGLTVPKRVVELRKWVEENLHPQLQFNEQEPSFFHDILVIRKVNIWWNGVVYEREREEQSSSASKCSSM